MAFVAVVHSETSEVHLVDEQLPELSTAEKLAAAKSLLSSQKFTALNSGTSVSGLHVATDDVSQTRIAGAALAAMLDPDYTVRWKCTDGQFYTLTAPQILAVAQAVRAHVQACYDREADLLAAIAAAADPLAVDLTTGWPT